MADSTHQQRTARILRQWLPWLVGGAILVAIVMRIPFSALQNAIGRGSHGWVAIAIALTTVVQLVTDAIATWVGLIALRMRRPFATVMAVRGATYLLLALNYAISQGGFGYYLH